MKFALTLLVALAGSVMAAEKAPIILVLTNHGELGKTGEPTGFYLSEAAHPHHVFTEAGHEVTLASPEGGFAPLDPKSLELQDGKNAAFWETFGNGDDEEPGVPDTKKIADLRAEAFGGIFMAGGHGTMWDFPASGHLRGLISAIYTGGGVAGAVCHGPAAFVNLQLPDGSLLVGGREVAVFTNAEEKAVGLEDVMPFMLETAFEDMGATVRAGANFKQNAVRDGRLVTGQNPASAEKAAELFVEAMAGIDETPATGKTAADE